MYWKLIKALELGPDELYPEDLTALEEILLRHLGTMQPGQYKSIDQGFRLLALVEKLTKKKSA